ncbi:Putative syntaxin-24 [Apostasia shenzhenica]|uniref:Syntaxin-24 n=1 Tax=Apostasia shenzhenica TaxID=1088818 RepID=A0A2I0A819_9ASPA|nr:Putative syntaxin-24 [Apostasia shenzhenica]
MAELKPAAPAGANYGRPVPCETLHCCGGFRCLFCTLFKIVAIIAVILGTAALIHWLIFRHNHLKVHVESAALTQFNLTGDNVLRYNLNLTVSVRNPNRKNDALYDHVEAQVTYDGSTIGFKALPAFYQGNKNTTTLISTPSFEGQNFLLGDSPATFRRESREGFFNIKVRLYAKMRLKAGIVKTSHIKPRIDCEVRLPAPGGSDVKTPAFERTKCHVDY